METLDGSRSQHGLRQPHNFRKLPSFRLDLIEFPDSVILNRDLGCWPLELGSELLSARLLIWRSRTFRAEFIIPSISCMEAFRILSSDFELSN